MTALGLLIVRLVIGLTMAAHGTQKLFGWFGGYGPRGTGGFFESIGIRPGVALAVMAGLAELAGGLLFAAGLFTELAAALIVLTMLVAIVKVHNKSYWVTASGSEYNVALIAVAIGIALIGAGEYSIDALWR